MNEVSDVMPGINENESSVESGGNPELDSALPVGISGSVKLDGTQKHDTIPSMFVNPDQTESRGQSLRLFNTTLYPNYYSEKDISKLSEFGAVSSGIVRICQRNNRRAYITSPSERIDVLIEGLFDRNRALEGDEVYYITRPGHDMCRKTGIVIALKKKNHSRGAVGTVIPPGPESDFVLFIPRDMRIPKMRIKKKNCPIGIDKNPRLYEGVLFYGIIKEWTDVRYAEGEIAGVVDDVYNIVSGTEEILIPLGVPRFTEYLKSFSPLVPRYINPGEERSREDFRNECVFTIDPCDTADLERAVSCKFLVNGNYLVGVHVADVSFFLRGGTPLDSVVRKRGTCIYLVNKTYHLLPRKLRSICSLSPGYDRFAISVLLEITPGGELVSSRISRSLVNSCAQFSHSQVQDIIRGGGGGTCFPPITEGYNPKYLGKVIKTLNEITYLLRDKRYENGAFTVSRDRITYNLKGNGFPVSYELSKLTESHNMVKELMVLANETVAKQIYTYFPNIALLRKRSPPLKCLLEQTKTLVEQHGVELDISSSSALNSSLARYCGCNIQSVGVSMVLKHLLSQALPRGEYYCGDSQEGQDKKHFGLGVDLYTHFTSPMKRYADITVHRLLAATLSLYEEIPDWPPGLFHSIADYCNERKYAVKTAQERSESFFFDLYMSDRSPVVYDAVVSHINGECFDCILLETGSRHTVFFTSYDGITTVVAENGGKLRLIVTWSEADSGGEKTQVIELFTIVKLLFTASLDEENVKVTLWRHD